MRHIAGTRVGEAQAIIVIPIQPLLKAPPQRGPCTSSAHPADGGEGESGVHVCVAQKQLVAQSVQHPEPSAVSTELLQVSDAGPQFSVG